MRLRILQMLCGQVALLIALVPVPVASAASFFVNSAAFMAALSAPSTTQTFEGLAPGTPVGTLANITFSETVPGENLIATDHYSAVSGMNMLGLDNFYYAFLYSQELTLTFASPVYALGLFVVTDKSVQADEIFLATSVGDAPNSATEESMLLDGGHAYFIGLVSASAFTSATLEYSDDGETQFIYNVDNVTTAVPEPGSAALLLLGLATIATLQCRPRRGLWVRHRVRLDAAGATTRRERLAREPGPPRGFA